MPHGYGDDEWDAAKEAVREVLSARAAERRTITYAELTSRPLGPVDFRPDDPSLGRLLGEVSAEEFAAGRGMLSAVVVRKHGSAESAGRPGAGFFALAERLGRDVGLGRDARDAFWRSELSHVFDANSR